VFGVTEDYFRTLRLRAAAGALLPQLRDDDGVAEQVAVISYAMWRARFAQSPAVVGQRLTINGASFTITGVAPERFRGITPSRGRGLAVWVPLAAAHRLVTGPPSRLVLLLPAVEPQVRPADGGVGDADDRVRRLLDARVRDALDADVAGGVKDGCSHVESPFMTGSTNSLRGPRVGFRH
jgi:hypothetical protein